MVMCAVLIGRLQGKNGYFIGQYLPVESSQHGSVCSSTFMGCAYVPGAVLAAVDPKMITRRVFLPTRS